MLIGVIRGWTFAAYVCAVADARNRLKCSKRRARYVERRI